MKKAISIIICAVIFVSLALCASADATDYLNWKTRPADGYDNIEYLSDGYVIFTTGGRKGVMSYDGAVKIKAEYGEIAGIGQGVLQTANPDKILRVDEDYAVLSEEANADTVMNSIIVRDMSSDKTVVAKFDGNGTFVGYNEVSDSMYPCVVRGAEFTEVEGEDYISPTDRYGYADSSDSLLFKIEYEGGIQISSNLFALKKDGLWAFFLSDGSELTGYKYSDTIKNIDALGDTVGGIYAPSDGYIAVNKGGKYGYISATTGNPAVPFAYDGAMPVNNGSAWVCVDGKWGIADMNSIPPQIASVTITGFAGDTSTLTNGTKLHIEYTVTPESAKTMPLSWQSSDESKATVSDGVLTAVSPGEVKVSAYNVFGDFVGGYTFTIAASDSIGINDGNQQSDTETPADDESPDGLTQSDKEIDEAENTIILYSAVIGVIAMLVTAVILYFTTAAKNRKRAEQRRQRREREAAERRDSL